MSKPIVNDPLRQFLRRAIEQSAATDEECESSTDEEACWATHPIHEFLRVGGELRMVTAEVDALIDVIMNWVGNVYISTGCQHGNHEHCACSTSVDGGQKTPGKCKFCEAKCFCPCHREQVGLSEFELSAYVHHETHRAGPALQEDPRGGEAPHPA